MGFLSFLGPVVNTVAGIGSSLLGTVGGLFGGGGAGGGGGAVQAPATYVTPQGAPQPSMPPSSGETFMTKYLGWIIGGVALLAVVVIAVVSGKKNRSW